MCCRLTHRLSFETEEKIVRAKDANVQNEDTFDIYDPRNPLNKRRRGEEGRKKREKHQKEQHRRETGRTWTLLIHCECVHSAVCTQSHVCILYTYVLWLILPSVVELLINLYEPHPPRRMAWKGWIKYKLPGLALAAIIYSVHLSSISVDTQVARCPYS